MQTGGNQNETIPISRKADHGLHPLFTRGGARYRHVRKIPAGRRPRPGPRTSLPALGSHLRHRHPRFRSMVYHCRSRAGIPLKGKIRTTLLPAKLCRKLLQYARKQKNRLRQDFSHGKRQKPVAQAGMGEFVFVLEYILSKSSFRRDHKQQRPRSANHALFTRFINSLLFGSLYCSCTSAHRH